MKTKNILQIISSEWFPMGPLTVGQPLPSAMIQHANPFILLHHGRQSIAPNSASRLGPHPHRGFEPVTFIFEGEIEHRDSAGNTGILQSGGVQWMTAGSGVLHSEGASKNYLKTGGELELIQLWINLPAKDKMTSPKYQDMPYSALPKISEGLTLISGEYNQQIGPAKTFTPIISMMGNFKQSNHFSLSLPENYHTLIYLLKGEAAINQQIKNKENLIVFSPTGTEIDIHTSANCRMLILSAEPIQEKFVAHGPFVMNTQQEIHQAIVDYQLGKMGVLNY